MHLLALIQGFDVPSSRYRVLQWLPFWQAAGHSVDVLEHAAIENDLSEMLDKVRAANVVLFHRKRLSPRLVRRLVGGGRAVYDVDDAVMFRDALKTGRGPSWLRQWRYGRMVRAMDQVIVGNRYIAEHTPVDNNRIAVLPTCLDTERYGWTPPPESVAPTLVWIGDGGSLHYLEGLREELEEIGRRVPGCRLKIISSRFLDLNHVEVLKIPWSAESEVDELADASVGLMPLKADLWSRGKCALKFLQYLAVGRPAVVSPYGLNSDLLAAAPCGLAATTPREWVEGCVSLLTDSAQRQALGKAGFRLVRQRFSLKARAQEWVHLVAGEQKI